MYTAQEVFDMAIALIDEISTTGTINSNDVKEYSSRAPYLLNMWQSEWGRIEHITVSKITSLSQTLQISDENCPSAAYFLAKYFANADQNSELENICTKEYERLKREGRKPSTSHSIVDVYGGV